MMERVTDERIADILDGLIYNKHSVIEALKELQARRKAEKEQGHTDNSASEKDGAGATQERERAILPLPVKQVDGVGVKTWTVKQWFQKINEELDELKDAVWFGSGGLGRIDHISSTDKFAIADEAADTITVIASMLEAMGIDEQQRQAAQRRVNEHNKRRGRI